MNEWEKTTLGEIAFLKNGKSSPKRIENGKYQVWGSNGVIGYSEHKNSHGNTIIIGRVGSYCGSIYLSKEECWVTDNAIIGNNIKGISDSVFLYYFLNNYNLHRLRGGSGQPLINQSILSQIELKIPPLEEQRAIASVLSCLDGKIENLRKQNETLESIAQTLFKHWFIDFEFPNEDGKPYKSNPLEGRCDRPN
ncbi:restriction endonuclease subunit S [Geminocystis sp.]|uniref:restriction endonuclease subunit S n=1 Tax=Geminocystis sp. TaxID=2664100 RepID=UPI003593E555